MALMRPGESQKDVIGGYASQSVMVFLNFTSIVEQTNGLFLIIQEFLLKMNSAFGSVLVTVVQQRKA
jgi:hypothetical protein